jgi:O-antigen/teichoic acid export membrane protein
MMPKLTPGVTQTLYYAAGLVMTRSVSLLMLPLVTHKLAPESYGELEVLTALAHIGTIVLGFGLVDALYRFGGLSANASERKRVCANVFGLAVCVGLLFGVIGQLLAPALTSALPGSVDELDVRLILVALTLEGAIAIPLSWLRMQEKAKQFFILSSSKALIQALMVFVFLELGYGVTGMVAASAISATLLAMVLAVLQFRDCGIRLERDSIKTLVCYGLPIMVSGIAAFVLSGLDRWVVAGSVGVADLAAYAVAIKFATVAALLAQPYGLWWFARRFQVLRAPDGERDCARLAAMGACLGFVAACLVGLLSPVAITYLTPPAYHAACEYVVWLVLIFAIKNCTDLFNIGCYAGNSSHVQMLIELGVATMGVIGYIVLVPQYGIPGAISTLIGASLLRFVLFFYFSQRALALPYPLKRLFVLALVCILALLLGQLPSTSVERVIVAFGLIMLVMAGAFTTGLVPHPRKLLLHRLQRAT